jgi:hypothetical protein
MSEQTTDKRAELKAMSQSVTQEELAAHLYKLGPEMLARYLAILAEETDATIAQLRAAVGRLERIEAAARLYMKDASDDSTDALTMLGSFNALAAALAADGERGTG